MISGVVSRFVPDFLTEEEYESQRKQVFDKLQENQGMWGMSAREIHEHTDLLLNDVRARLHELAEDGYVLKLGKAKCSVASHDRLVWQYYAPDNYGLENIGGSSE